MKIVHKDGHIVFQGSIIDLPLKEEYIIKKSIELFHEKEPCIIYRTHVMNKFYLKLYDFLNCLDGTTFSNKTISDYMKDVELDITDSVLYYDK